jgi:hypothetical protein
MRSRAVRHAGRCIGLVAMVGVPGVAYAQDIQPSLVASIGGSAESNPYNQTTTDGVAVAATAELNPRITVRDDRTTIDISANAQFRQFFRRYGLDDSYGVNTGIVSRQSEWLTLRGSGSFSYSRGGFNGFGRPGLSSADPVVVTPDPTVPTPPNPLVSLSDVNIIGLRTPVTSYGSTVGADVRVSERSNLSIDFDTRAMRFKRTARLDDYNNLHGELSYNYSLNDTWSVGLVGGYGKTNYLDLGRGDAGTTDALASLNGKLGARWTVALSVGGSFTSIDGRGGRPDVHFSSITTRARFCWQGQYSNFCLGGQRSPQPAADGNVRVSTTITGDYSLRLSDREHFSLSGSYAKTGRSRDLTLGAQPGIDFLSASARYDNQLNQRLSAFVNASASKIYSPLQRSSANVGISMGLQIRIGAGQ